MIYINGVADVGWTPTGNGGTKVANADIEAAAGILLTKLETIIHPLSGLFANRPAAADLPNGSWYYGLDTEAAYQVVGGAWVLKCAPGIFEPAEASVAMFQAGATSGTMFDMGYINDNDPGGSCASATAVGQYTIIDYGKCVIIKRYRHYGHVTQNGDGVWKIQYYDDDAWQDWETGIPTRGASWSAMETPAAGEKTTSRVRLYVVTKDSSNQSKCGELEVIF